MKYVYKVGAALLGLAVIPLIYFGKFVYFYVSSDLLDVITKLLKDGQTFAVADSFSLNTIIQTYREIGDNNLFSNIDGDAFSGLMSPLLTLVTVMGILAITGLVLAIFAIFCKDNRKVIYTSVWGLGFCAVFKLAFDAVANPILDGTYSVANMLGNSFIAGLLGDSILTVDKFELTTLFWIVPVLFVLAIIWTVCYNFTLSDEQKQERKLSLGEAD
ncbi:MAG: hypothetical protein ACI4IF_03170 [Acutalibacteraceae bacterium]